MYCGTTWHTTKQAHPLHPAVRGLSFLVVCLMHMEKIRSFFLIQENFKLQFLFCLKCIYYLSVSLFKMDSWLEINILLRQTKGCIWKSWKWAWRGKIHFSFQDPFSVLKRKWTNIYWLITISQGTRLGLLFVVCCWFLHKLWVSSYVQIKKVLGWPETQYSCLGFSIKCFWASLVAQLVRNPPAMQETWVQFLGW